jgi:predicted PurR-regulated permease PerM
VVDVGVPGRAQQRSTAQFALGLGGLAFLVLGGYVVLAPFLASITWAAILAYATWPIHREIRRRLGSDLWTAAVMMALVILAIAGPVTLLSLALADDVARVYRQLRSWGDELPLLPAWVGDLPVAGPWLAGWYDALRANPGALQQFLVDQAPRLSQPLLQAAGDLGRNLGRLGLTLLTLFFLYRHGETVLGQTSRVMSRVTGQEIQRRLEVVGITVRAVCYGVLLTALAQGVLAGVGFWAAGVPAAVLLGALTALAALVPFGPPLIWAPIGLWVLATGSVAKGIGLLLWGALVVSTVDNVLRPFFISGRTKIPFLLLLCGVLGGLAAFGLVGLFVGPTILAVLLALWHEWADYPDAQPGDT